MTTATTVIPPASLLSAAVATYARLPEPKPDLIEVSFSKVVDLDGEWTVVPHGRGTFRRTHPPDPGVARISPAVLATPETFVACCTGAAVVHPKTLYLSAKAFLDTLDWSAIPATKAPRADARRAVNVAAALTLLRWRGVTSGNHVEAGYTPVDINAIDSLGAGSGRL